mgnify:CR=1 FL=1
MWCYILDIGRSLLATLCIMYYTYILIGDRDYFFLERKY